MVLTSTINIVPLSPFGYGPGGRVVLYQSEGRCFNAQPLQSTCHCFHAQETEPQIAPDGWDNSV